MNAAQSIVILKMAAIILIVYEEKFESRGK
jgi:hypothetical protein